MPLTKCSANGTSGWKWGNAGHCYTGPSAKKQAIKQGLAEGGGKLEAADLDQINEQEFNEVMADSEIPMMTRVNLANAKKLSYEARQDLTNSQFAIIIDGKGHFPIHDAAHVRNALARLPQSNLTPEQKKTALSKIREAAKKFGIDKGEPSNKIGK